MSIPPADHSQNEFLTNSVIAGALSPSDLHLTSASVDKSHLMAANTQAKIYEAIQSEQLPLSSSPSNEYPLQKRGSNQKIEQQRQQILHKKTQMLRDLSELEQMSSSLLKESHLRNRQKLSMSRLQPQDKKLIKQLTKQRRKHEKELEKRVRKYEDGIVEFKQHQKDEERQKIEAQKEQRRFVAQEKVAKIKEREGKRAGWAEKEREAVTQLQKKKKLFQRMQNNFFRSQQAEEAYRKRELSQIHEAKSTSFTDIRSHQHAHDDYMSRKATLRKSRLHYSSQHLTKKHKVRHLYGGMPDEKRRLLESTEKWNTMMAKIQNNIVFSEKVRQDAKKYLRSTEESRFVIKESERREEMERGDNHDQGVEFMRAANRHNVVMREARLKKSSTTTNLQTPRATEEKENSKPAPVDYLHEMKLKRKAVSPEQRFWKCLRRGDVEKAVTMAGGLQGKSEGSPFKNAMRKLKMLEALE